MAKRADWARPRCSTLALNLAQFWDGRAKDLREQAGGPIANPGEMAFTHDLAVDLLRLIPEYVAEFKKVFGNDKLSIDEVTLAIAAFEETLVTPDARFDQWLKGNKKRSERARSCAATKPSKIAAASPATTGQRGRQFIPENGYC